MAEEIGDSQENGGVLNIHEEAERATQKTVHSILSSSYFTDIALRMTLNDAEKLSLKRLHDHHITESSLQVPPPKRRGRARCNSSVGGDSESKQNTLESWYKMMRLTQKEMDIKCTDFVDHMRLWAGNQGLDLDNSHSVGKTNDSFAKSVANSDANNDCRLEREEESISIVSESVGNSNNHDDRQNFDTSNDNNRTGFIKAGSLNITPNSLENLAQKLFPYACPLSQTHGKDLEALKAESDKKLKRKVVAEAICMAYIHDEDQSRHLDTYWSQVASLSAQILVVYLYQNLITPPESASSSIKRLKDNRVSQGGAAAGKTKKFDLYDKDPVAFQKLSDALDDTVEGLDKSSKDTINKMLMKDHSTQKAQKKTKCELMLARGHILQLFQKKHTSGPLVLFAKDFTRSFLNDKCPHSGKAVMNADQRLKTLGVKEEAKSIGATIVGDALLKYLIANFGFKPNGLHTDKDL